MKNSKYVSGIFWLLFGTIIGSIMIGHKPNWMTMHKSDYKYTTTKNDKTLVSDINTVISGLNQQQKQYIKDNEELLSKASAAYGFIIANDYKAVRWCLKHYPVSKYQKAFDKQFKDKKIKAENILEKAYGSNGPRIIRESIINNPTVLKGFDEQMESRYNEFIWKSVTNGVYGRSREDYCKMIDKNADNLVKNDLDLFKTMFQNF